jgi:hypothetical protein
MKGRILSVLWGLAAMGILAMGLLLRGDQVSPHRLTCTDLLNMPLEDLMQVQVVSKLEDSRRHHKPSVPSPSALLNAPFSDPVRVATFS